MRRTFGVVSKNAQKESNPIPWLMPQDAAGWRTLPRLVLRNVSPRKARIELLLKMLQDRFCLSLCDHGRKGGHIGLFYSLQTAEVFQQPAGGALANTRNLQQFGRAIANLAALAMESDSEAMGFVANQLHKMQDRTVMVEDNGFVFLPAHVDNFFTLGNSRQRLIDNLQ